MAPDIKGAGHRVPPRSPLQPWHNGRIERFFGTLKPLLRGLQLASAAAVRGALDEFKLFYNTVRPHQNLHGLTPEESWQGKTMADVQDARALGEGQ